MASIIEQATRKGTHYKVRFRQGSKQRAVSFATRDDAEAWVKVLDAVGPARALDILDDDRATDLAPTEDVPMWVTRHINSLSGITTGTRDDYHNLNRLSIAPFFAGLPLHLTDEDAVRRWIQWMHDEQGHSAKTIRNRHSLLSAALKSANRAGKLTCNPAEGTRIPRTLESLEHTYLTKDEFEHFLRCVDGFYRPFVYGLAATGLRFGEMTAQQVKHVDHAVQGLRVRQAWKAGSPAVLGPPKTPKSQRTAAGPDDLFRLLRVLCAGRGPDEFVFVNKAGEPIKRSTFYRNVWEPARAQFAGDRVERVRNPVTGRWQLRVLEKGPGKRPRVHDLRHTYASWAIQANIPLPVLQRQLGHESIQTTVDTYGHLARADFDALASATALNLPSITSLPGTLSQLTPRTLAS